MKLYKIPKHPVFKDFALVKTLSGTYVCPGWHPVDEGTTRDQIVLVDAVINNNVKKNFTPAENKVKQIKKYKVKSSRGDKFYTVANNNGQWSCDCPASQFFRGPCKHIKSLKKEKYELSS